MKVCEECRGTGESVYFTEVDRDENTVKIEKRKGICRTCNGMGYSYMTNADKIRSMSDREIAEFLAGKFTDHTTNILSGEGMFRTATGISEEAHFWFESWMQWLSMSVGDE